MYSAPSGCGSPVADPFAPAGDYGLPRAHTHRPSGMLHAQGSFQNNREFVELGRLSRLLPASRAAHVGYAGGGGSGVDVSDVFVD